MSNVLFQRIDADVNFLVSAVDQGTLGLPDLQRPFVWSTSKVRDLFDSMYRGYPVGYLMLWANPVAPGTAKQIGTEGHGQDVPATLIIDGQQRLTSLYAAMKGRPVLDKNFRERPITIAFHPLREAFDVANAAIRKSPEWIADVSAVFANDADAYTLVSGYLDRLGEVREVSPDERKQASQAIGRLLALKGYPFSALQINADADEEAVAEIFVRVNSRGREAQAERLHPDAPVRLVARGADGLGGVRAGGQAPVCRRRAVAVQPPHPTPAGPAPARRHRGRAPARPAQGGLPVPAWQGRRRVGHAGGAGAATPTGSGQLRLGSSI